MNVVESLQIFGFWGNSRVDMKFERDINFLIGPNGSGKTTIINLLAAALKADISTLYSIPFEKIVITLKAKGLNKKPIIELTKAVNEAMGNLELAYVIKEKTTDKGTRYGVEGPFEERLYRDGTRIRTRRFQEMGARLGAILEQVVQVNWLSVHRGTLDRFAKVSREEEYDSSVDQKIAEISQKFSSYFSYLTSKASEETKLFQEQVFLSLLEQPPNLFGSLSQASLESEERSAVLGVLKDLGVSNTKAARSVQTHYARLESANRSWRDDGRISLDEAVTLSDARRISQTIRRWRQLNYRRTNIFSPKLNFEKIINSLFTGKELHFDQRNIPSVHLNGGGQLPISALSSGEKQLFILLGEALLQEGKPVLFISDEPELSLHVAWQNRLFENIRQLNPSCQIISATHSPDIVGPFQSRIIKIEGCISHV
ncbi:AAA family ATPase [Labrys neptuniae]